jgi:carbamoyltransferase
MGKRALGNRSFLYDPTDVFAKEKLNMLKNREWFRPTAGTVLFEHAHEWFDLKLKKETPFMSYVFNVKKESVPGITHIDNTCRIQTLKKEQNFYYYNLINEFYKLTNVPMLLNTSFNLAGQPLINSVEDAIYTLMSTKNNFHYLYFPEIGKMYLKKQFKQ